MRDSLLDYTTLEAESKESQGRTPKQMQSLYEVCQQVEVVQGARGKRYELAGLLVVLILAKLAGMRNLLAASDWIADQEALVREDCSFRGNACRVPIRTAMPSLARTVNR